MNIISKIIDYIMMLSLGIMSIIVFINVVLRYLFESGISWSVELSQILFLLLVFFGAIQAYKENTHIHVDVLISKVPVIWQKVLAVVSNLIILYILYVLFKGSVQLVEENTVMTTPILGIPQSYIYAMGVILSVLIGILTIIKTVQIFRKTEEEASVEE